MLYRADLITLAAVLAVYLGTRLWRLGVLPMFIDEGMYITWSLQALHARTALDTLVSVTDGKQPLFPWLMAPLLATVPERLIAARLTSVIAGAASVLVTYWLARRLYGRPTALVAAALYVLAPFAFFYDRIALYDGLIATCGLVCLATSVWWLARPTASRTVLLGLVMGLTLLTKVSAAVIVVAAPVAALALLPDRWRLWWRVAGAYCLGGLVFAALLLHPQARMLFDGTSRYAFTPAELRQLPWHTWQQNAGSLVSSLTGYLPAPLWWCYAAGLLLPFCTRDRRDATLVVWCLALLGTTLVANKVFYFRYYLPGAVAGLLPCARVFSLAGAALRRLVGRIASDGWSSWLGPRVPRCARDDEPPRGAGFGVPSTAIGLLCLAALPGLGLVWGLWRDPRTAALPDGTRSDRQQYVLSQEAGWGADGVATYLRAQAAKQDIVVLLTPLNANMRAWVGSQLLYRPRTTVVLRNLQQTPEQQILSLDPADDVRRFALGGGAVYVAISEYSGDPRSQPLVEDDHQPARLVADFARPDMPWRQRAYQLAFPHEVQRVRFDAPPRFGGHISLLGYDLEPAVLAPGITARVTFYWRTDQRLAARYVAFLHLVSASSDAEKLAQHDGEPASGRAPTDRWQPGQTVEDQAELTLPAQVACGSYRLLAGLYDRTTLQRLPATAGRLPVSNDAVQLQTIQLGGC